MARTGRSAQRLRSLLVAAGMRPAASKPPRPLFGALAPELLDLYRLLGGRQARPTLRPGPWDLVFDGPLAVELDEELHFNRYRATTLTASWELEVPWRPDYLRYCIDHEPACLEAGKWGGRWTNPSCERMFTGAPPGILDGHGAPRWKQRALYDAMKDGVRATGKSVGLGRLAVYDDIDGQPLGTALESGGDISLEALLGLVNRRRT